MENKIAVCVGKVCRSKGSAKLYDYIDVELHKYDCPILKLSESIDLKISLCNKYCQNGPLAIWKDQVFLHMDETRADQLIKAIYEYDSDLLSTLDPKPLHS